jgi:hypothetical protein
VLSPLAGGKKQTQAGTETDAKQQSGGRRCAVVFTNRNDW